MCRLIIALFLVLLVPGCDNAIGSAPGKSIGKYVGHIERSAADIEVYEHDGRIIYVIPGQVAITVIQK